MTSEQHVYHTSVSTDNEALSLWASNATRVSEKGGMLNVSVGFGSVPPALVLALPDGTDPKTILDVEWTYVGAIPNEKNQGVGEEPPPDNN